jgi:hypothetical protein
MDFTKVLLSLCASRLLLENTLGELALRDQLSLRNEEFHIYKFEPPYSENYVHTLCFNLIINKVINTLRVVI